MSFGKFEITFLCLASQILTTNVFFMFFPCEITTFYQFILPAGGQVYGGGGGGERVIEQSFTRKLHSEF